MAFYWVFQNTTYEEESLGSYLWAPKKNKKNQSFFHWQNMKYLQEGDIVFSSVNKSIVAVSTVLSKCYDQSKPLIDKDGEWESDGYKVDLNFHELESLLTFDSFPKDVLEMFNVEYGPINRKGTGNQGYLYHISDEAGSNLISLIENRNTIDIETKFEEDVKKENINETTKKAIIESRIGQGQFRKELINFWDGKCAVTGVLLTDILIASHIKPWKVSNNIERLDRHNGLLLSPTYDKLFDAGYISFDLDGKIIISELLSEIQLEQLNINKEDKLIKKLGSEFNNYLVYHKENILKK